MSYTERVLLDIKITLQNVRAVHKELDAVKTKVQDLSLSPKKQQLMADNSAAVGFRNMIKQIDSEAERLNSEADDKYYAAMQQRSAAKYEVMQRDRQEQLTGIRQTIADNKAAAKEQADENERIAKESLKRQEAYHKTVRKLERQRIADMEKEIKKGFAAAFSLHIIQMYVSPFTQAIQQAVMSTISSFTEFERYYADYLGKSADFTEVMSRGEIFNSAVGQVYSINNMADAMERFAASGIDITKNEQALTDVLQLARTAQIDYTEAANAVIKTQEAFQLSVDDSTMIVDALTSAANSSTAELKDLTEWFGYASGMAHETSITVQELAAYLGILSSTGMKSAGTAFRQMLVQFTDEGVRQKINSVFGAEFDFLKMDETLLRMREYVQTSSNQAEVIQQISNALGGKVNAREALARLLTADEGTWNRIMGAVSESGTSAELFDTVTDNAADTLLKVQNNITLIKAQVGEIFAPLITIAEKITSVVATLMNITPSFVKKWLFGGILVVTAAITALMTVLTTLAGLFFVVTSALDMFNMHGKMADFSIKKLVANFIALNKELFLSSGLLNKNALSLAGLQGQLGGITGSFGSMQKAMLAAGVSMGAYAAQSYAAAEQQYSLAKAMNIVAAISSGASAAMAVGGGVQGALVGVAVGGAALYAGQSQLSRAEDELTLSRRNKMWYQSSNAGGSVYSNNSKNIQIDNAYFSTDELDADSFINTVGNV